MVPKARAQHANIGHGQAVPGLCCTVARPLCCQARRVAAEKLLQTRPPAAHSTRAAARPSAHLASSTVPQVINAAELHCSTTEGGHGESQSKHNR